MKRIILYAFMLVLTGTAVNLGQNQTGGKVKYLVRYEGESTQLTIYMLNNNLRMDKKNSTRNESFLFVNGLSVVMYPAQQVYVEYNDIKDSLLDEKPPLFAGTKDDLKLTKTGIKEKITGIECEKWILKNQVTSVEMWVNKEIEFNKNFIDLLPKYFVDWQKVLKTKNAFSLLVEIKDDLGNVIYSFEASEIDFKTPPDNLFIIPGNFVRTDKMEVK
jgi:uncharacterized protein (DUF779 family)